MGAGRETQKKNPRHGVAGDTVSKSFLMAQWLKDV